MEKTLKRCGEAKDPPVLEEEEPSKKTLIKCGAALLAKSSSGSHHRRLEAPAAKVSPHSAKTKHQELALQNLDLCPRHHGRPKKEEEQIA
jgi:hypothetical protein